MKRAILAAAVVITVLAVAYGFVVTRRERLYRQLIVQGDLAMGRADAASAVAAFGEAIVLKPDAMLGHLKRGDAHRRHGDLTAAARDLERARSLNPTEPRALELLGDVAMSRQLHSQAAEYFASYVTLDDRPRVLYKLGLAHHLAGNHAQAADALRKALKADGRLAEAHYVLGLSLRTMRQLRAAQAAFERAAGLSPALLSAREQLADVYGLLGRRPERIKQLEELVHADPGPARQVALASAYADAGQVPRAIRLLRVATDLYPAHAGTYIALGRLWLEQAHAGDHVALAKAQEALHQALSMEPSSEVLMLLGQVHLLGANPLAAERTLRQATETLPAEPGAFLSLADAAERTGHAEVARRALVEYQALTGTDNTEFLVRIARAHWRSGDTGSARATLARVLDKDPDNQAGRELAQRVR